MCVQLWKRFKRLFECGWGILYRPNGTHSGSMEHVAAQANTHVHLEVVEETQNTVESVIPSGHINTPNETA